MRASVSSVNASTCPALDLGASVVSRKGQPSAGRCVSVSAPEGTASVGAPCVRVGRNTARVPKNERANAPTRPSRTMATAPSAIRKISPDMHRKLARHRRLGKGNTEKCFTDARPLLKQQLAGQCFGLVLLEWRRLLQRGATSALTTGNVGNVGNAERRREDDSRRHNDTRSTAERMSSHSTVRHTRSRSMQARNRSSRENNRVR